MQFHLSFSLHSSTGHSITFRCSDADVASVEGRRVGRTPLTMSSPPSVSFFPLPASLSYLHIWVRISPPDPLIPPFFFLFFCYLQTLHVSSRLSGIFHTDIDIQIIIRQEITPPFVYRFPRVNFNSHLVYILHPWTKSSDGLGKIPLWEVTENSFLQISKFLCANPWAKIFNPHV